jgi:hypothetical protein
MWQRDFLRGFFTGVGYPQIWLAIFGGLQLPSRLIDTFAARLPSPMVNFTNILRAVFPQIFLRRQKSIKSNFKYKKASHETFI